MWSEVAPDQCHNIAVDGYNVVAYQFGDGDETVPLPQRRTRAAQRLFA